MLFLVTMLTLNDLYDTACMTHNWLSNFYGVYTIMQIVHTNFIKVVLTDYSGFTNSSKMIKNKFQQQQVKEKESKKKPM